LRRVAETEKQFHPRILKPQEFVSTETEIAIPLLGAKNRRIGAVMPDWKEHGIRIVRSGELDSNTPQTPGMTRAEAISHARVGAQKLWAGTVVVHPDAKTGPHHHGELETVIYVVRGRARFRWGDKLEFVDEAGPGDFIYVPPFVPHQELNARRDQPVEAVIVRSGQEPIVVNLDIPSPENADAEQPDPFHSAGR
jgi:uncharacterized RmlC-like cupin family protein